jgi:hypothetical protein
MLLGSRSRPVRRTGNLAAICETIVYTMLDPEHLTILEASTACYGDNFFYRIVHFNIRHYATNRKVAGFIPDEAIF